MSTFLELAQAAKRESGLTGGGPTAFASATGDDERFFHWVAWAWRDIDLMHESWKWRRGTATATTTTSSRTLTPTDVVGGFGLTDFGSWIHPTEKYKPSAYSVADGQRAETELSYLEYDSYRKKFILGVHQEAAVTVWTDAPNGDFLVGPTPSQPYVVRADYIKDHIALAADADVPAMPTRFHMLIVWYALRQYGGYDAAGEVWQRANQNYNSLFSALTQAQLPRMRWGGSPLA